ncbi:hypothetical protein HG536_0D05570 [Torulaspora globosa]|uniref:Cyclin N-terminal domain-containing protein n=1 Tax=Torulaspora globosa TaxID=48254 RepID=A0A7G3ZHQ0_9SACH|nr:uncharacterized protein HG536_0D05570 [Torulaspora globosa]QLL33036.1 hypothetical protein HG536_0D05570 [Torulaspora globosa]
MATFMYYPGHYPAASCGAGNFGPVMQQHSRPAHHQHSYSVDSAARRSDQASMNAYGYYPPAPLQNLSSFQPPFYHQPVLPHPTVSHHRQASSFLQNNLPPLGMYYTNAQVPAEAQAPVLPAPVVQEPAHEEQVNGGVNQFLDYELDMMSDFVVRNAYISFGCDLNAKSTQSMDLFIKGVSSVLNATRLPSVTIFLALDLLSKYIDRLPEGIQSIGGDSVNVIYQNTMIAFVIANKFNDDKTFTNKSWTQATGMSLSLVNEYERDWLSAFDWKIFDDKFISYEDYLQTFEVFCQEKRCPSPPVLLPTPHSSDNYLSPPSGYETPIQVSSNVYSSPCYYDEDKNDFCYSQLPQRSIMSSPVNLNYDGGYSACHKDYKFYNYNPQAMNRSWNSDETWKHQPNPNFARFDDNYYSYSTIFCG